MNIFHMKQNIIDTPTSTMTCMVLLLRWKVGTLFLIFNIMPKYIFLQVLQWWSRTVARQSSIWDFAFVQGWLSY